MGAHRAGQGGAGQPRPGGVLGAVGGGGSQGAGSPPAGGREAGSHLQLGPRDPSPDPAENDAAAGRPGAPADRRRFARWPMVKLPDEVRPRGRDMSAGEAIGVLAMAYGTAAGPDDIERYYTDIRGGRPPQPEQLEELRARYSAIGNRFPLLGTTRRQAEGMVREL